MSWQSEQFLQRARGDRAAGGHGIFPSAFPEHLLRSQPPCLPEFRADFDCWGFRSLLV